MSLNNEEKTIMVEFEIEKAKKLIEQFSVLQEANLWDTLANRMYYAVFHAVSALLIQNGLHAATHQGVFILLNKHFIKEKVIDDKFGHLYARLQTMREKSDYTCLFETTEEEIIPMIEPTKEMISIIESILKNNNN